MIKSIELTNWKTHKHTVMNFQQGVNVLVGVMGAGKSSVIDGISFGLFGTFPSLMHKRTTIENLISSRPKIEENAEVKIKFNIGDDDYTITRKISKKESTASKLEKNDAYLQTQTARVNEEIENLIKINYDTFSRAIYAEQNQLDYFLELTKSERKRQIDEMLGLDSFAKAEENSTSLINSIRSMIKDEEQMLMQIDLKELKAQLDKMTKEKQGLDNEQKTLIEQSKERESALKKMEKELIELKSKYERSKKITKEIAELSSKVDTLSKELNSIDLSGIDKSKISEEFDSKKKSKETYETELKKLRKEESTIVKTFTEADTLLKLNQKKIAERDKIIESMKGKELAAVEKQMKDKETELQRLMTELSTLKAKREEIKEWSAELAKHVSKCPVCERELDENMKNMLLDRKSGALKETELEIEKFGKLLTSMEKELGDSRKEYDTVRLSSSKLVEYKELDAAINKNSEDLKSGKEKHEKINSEIEKSEKEMEQLNKAINDLSMKIDAVKRKEKYEIEISESSKSRDLKSAELKELNIDERVLYTLQEQMTKESSSLSDINSKVKGNDRFIKSLEEQIEDKVNGIANINTMQERIEKKRTQINSMNKFRSALIETETQLRNNLVTSINALMQNIWSEIYPYGDYSSIRLNAQKDDYLLEACTIIDEKGNKDWIEIEGVASGGEKSIACLTMRIALAMVIVPNLRWLILDEPTHNIDENGIAKLIEVLGNSLPRVVEQIFIITHDNALKNISAARVYQLDRNKDRNEYTSVVEI